MALRTATSLTIARWYRRIATPGPLHLEPLQDAGYRSRRTVNYAHVMSRAPNQSKAIPIISIVDDDDGVREATASLVRSLGYRASTFASADEFLKSEQVSNTSCLITDVRMPGMSGIDLQDRLIADGHRIPIIFITGHPDDSVRARAMKAGAMGFLAKPVDTNHLIRYLEKASTAN